MNANPLIRPLLLAGGMLAGCAALAAARSAGLLDPDVTVRGAMALIGLFLAIHANDIPKQLAKDPRGQAVQRATGRAMVLAYLAWIAVWIFAPMSLATPLSVALVLLAIVWIVLACRRILTRAAREQSTP